MTPQPGAFDLAKAEGAHFGERATQILGKVLAQAPQLKAERAVQ